jgi:hypothetical protein
MRMWKTRLLAVTVATLAALVVGSQSARLLIEDNPRKSDVILVLAGETEYRPLLGLQLLDQGYASKLILDVPAAAKMYRWRQPELAQLYVQQLPQHAAISICPIVGLSTKAEAKDAVACLEHTGVHSVLLVTSDYHTRRALNIFRREAPAYSFSVAAARDPNEFGARWWRKREWAKVNFYEWLRLLWWEIVDRWN